MKNITLELAKATAAWMRLAAAGAGKTAIHLFAGLFAQRRRAEREYPEAMRRYLKREPARIRDAESPLPTRESLHERAEAR